ncbi:hypothetical protein, partial [Prevotella intermedia]|uniref:hypothetical protein n=1 Tax=Prevotella intermedia TaxID=28131 RepID=UPI00138E37A5
AVGSQRRVRPHGSSATVRTAMIPLHQSLAKDYGKQQQHMAYSMYGVRANWTHLSNKLDRRV